MKPQEQLCATPYPTSEDTANSLMQLLEDLSRQMVATQDALDNTIQAATTTTLDKMQEKIIHKYLGWTLIPLGKHKGQPWQPPKILINPYLKLYIRQLQKCTRKLEQLNQQFNKFNLNNP